MLYNAPILVYDENCAFCTWYGKSAAQYTLAKDVQSIGLSKLPPELFQLIDLDRASKEVPLILPNTNEVFYGVDAFVKLNATRLPFLQVLANNKFCYAIMSFLYRLISYNRTGIVAKIVKTNKIACAPPYSLAYKKYFIFFCYLLSVILMGTVHRNTFYNKVDLMYIASGLIVLVAILTANKLFLEFAMQWHLQVLIILFVLIPFSLLLPYVNLGAVLYFGLVCVLFIAQIKKRLQYLWQYNKVYHV